MKYISLTKPDAYMLGIGFDRQCFAIMLFCIVICINLEIFVKIAKIIKLYFTKTFFILTAAYLSFVCLKAALWIPFGFSLLVLIFIISTKNKELQ